MNKTILFIVELIVILLVLSLLLVWPPRYLLLSNQKINQMTNRLIEETYAEQYDAAMQTLQEIKMFWDKEKNIRAMIIEESYIMEGDNNLLQCETAVKTRNRSLAFAYANLFWHSLDESYKSLSFTAWNML